MLELAAEQNTFLNAAELFGRDVPLHVDLGCGNGSFLRAIASQSPDTNFIGVERLARRVRSSDRKAAQLPNVRIIRAETLFVLRHMLAPASVNAFYLLFPDPWPKRRHHRRRLVTPEFLEAISSRLTTDGSLFIVTDHQDYFAWIRQFLATRHDFTALPTDWTLPASTFEKKFLTTGLTIYRVELRKVSPVI